MRFIIGDLAIGFDTVCIINRIKWIVYFCRLHYTIVSNDVDFAITSHDYIIVIDVFQIIGKQIASTSNNLVKIVNQIPNLKKDVIQKQSFN